MLQPNKVKTPYCIEEYKLFTHNKQIYKTVIQFAETLPEHPISHWIYFVVNKILCTLNC